MSWPVEAGSLILTPSHHYRGGGNKPNEKLNNGSVSMLWMVNESSAAGLAVTPSRINWMDEDLENMQPKSPMNSAYRILERLPFNRRTYKDTNGKTRYRPCIDLEILIISPPYIRRPHMSKPRIIRPNQKIHISTCFIHGYTPLAKFGRDIDQGVSLAKIVGVGQKDRLDWIPEEFEKYIEADLFDVSQIPVILYHCTERNHPEGTENQLKRLGFLAGIRTCLSHLFTLKPGAQLCLGQQAKVLKQYCGITYFPNYLTKSSKTIWITLSVF